MVYVVAGALPVVMLAYTFADSVTIPSLLRRSHLTFLSEPDSPCPGSDPVL